MRNEERIKWFGVRQTNAREKNAHGFRAGLGMQLRNVCAQFFIFNFWENTLPFLLTEKDEFFSFFDTVERPPPPPFKNTTSSNSENIFKMISYAEGLDPFLLSRPG